MFGLKSRNPYAFVAARRTTGYRERKSDTFFGLNTNRPSFHLFNFSVLRDRLGKRPIKLNRERPKTQTKYWNLPGQPRGWRH